MKPTHHLHRLDCEFCSGEVVKTEAGRLVTEAEAGDNYSRIKAMVVAHAMCLACRAKYMAWIDVRAVVDGTSIPHTRSSDSIMTLSYRSTFGTDPGPDDMPEFSVVWRPELTPWPRCERCGKPRANAAEDDEECSDASCK